MGTAFRVAPRVFGGIQAPPSIPDVPFVVVHVLVLHCTSDIVRKHIYLLLATLTQAKDERARRAIHEEEGKTNVLPLHCRELRVLVANMIACPNLLGDEIDSGIIAMFALAQLICAAWRWAVGRGMEDEQEASAAVMELSVTLLAHFCCT